MESPCHATLTLVVFATICLSLFLASAQPFQYEAPALGTVDSEDEQYASERRTLDDLDKLRFLLTRPEEFSEAGPNMERRQLLQSMLADMAAEKSSGWTSKSKRFDFGFSGLDNIDHILTTLHRNEKPRFQSKQQSDLERLRTLMQKNG